MQTQFSATQSVVLDVPEQPVPIQHYLRQPQRLVYALVDPSQVEQLSADSFRLKMRPLKFLMLSLQPTVDMQVLVDAEGRVQLRSLACQIRGVDYINQRFQLQLKGQLIPKEEQGHTRLHGRADLTVGVELPPALMFTPKPFLEASGNSLLKSVLLTIKQRLMHQLLSDYCVWANAISPETASYRQSPALSAPTSTL
jgi:hypothetical protein